jgi:hypothetical protein
LASGRTICMASLTICRIWYCWSITSSWPESICPRNKPHTGSVLHTLGHDDANERAVTLLRSRMSLIRLSSRFPEVQACCT